MRVAAGMVVDDRWSEGSEGTSGGKSAAAEAWMYDLCYLEGSALLCQVLCVLGKFWG